MPIISLNISIDATEILFSALSESKKLLNPSAVRRDQEDIIWGKVTSTSSPRNLVHTTLGESSDNDHDDGHDYGFNNGYDDNGEDDDNEGYGDVGVHEENHEQMITTPPSSSVVSCNGVDIPISGGLLQAQRKVEKITIG